jgi:hypothetical protein
MKIKNLLAIPKSSLGALTLAAILMLGAQPARAEVTDNEKIDLTGFSVFVPCANNGAGELVVFEGNLHILFTFTLNGNHVSGKFHGQPQGLTGTGTVTGDKYQATGVTQDMFSGSLVNGKYTETYVNNFRIIGQGPGNNLLIHEVMHITINANGTVTVYFDKFSADCK